MKLAKIVAGNLQRARLAKGLSQAALAKRCVPATVQQQIDKLESCERRWSLEWVERLARALEIEPLQLFMPRRETARLSESEAHSPDISMQSIPNAQDSGNPHHA